MRLPRTIVTLATIATVLFFAPVHAQASSPVAAAPGGQLDGLIKQKMNQAGIVGLGAAIIINKQVVWTKGYGFADKARAVPFTPDTVMNIGSISKTITGVALMRAVQEGKLSLDENINTYLPFKVVHPGFPAEPITLRQLATHTSGMTDRWSVYESTYHYGGDSPDDLGDFLKSYLTPQGKYYANENFLNVKPGTHREYSNIGAGLAGYIVERATGEKLSVYSKQRIFAPLKMDSTGWFLADIALDKHAKLYVSQNGISVPIQLYGLTTYPDGGVRTSVADLSKLFIALLNNGEYGGTRILDRKSVEEMLRFQYRESNKPDNVSLDKKNSGIFWQSMFNVTRMGHGGSDPGLKTDMLSDLSREVGVILFTNTSLDEREMGKYNDIFNALWANAKALKAGPPEAAGD